MQHSWWTPQYKPTIFLRRRVRNPSFDSFLFWVCQMSRKSRLRWISNPMISTTNRSRVTQICCLYWRQTVVNFIVFVWFVAPRLKVYSSLTCIPLKTKKTHLLIMVYNNLPQGILLVAFVRIYSYWYIMEVHGRIYLFATLFYLFHICFVFTLNLFTLLKRKTTS